MMDGNFALENMVFQQKEKNIYTSGVEATFQNLKIKLNLNRNVQTYFVNGVYFIISVYF